MTKEITPENSIVPVYLEPWTAEQLAQLEEESLRLQKIQGEQQAAKESAIAKLKKLGLTDDEIAAFLT